MTDSSHYAIRGGAAGRERLRVLARVMHAGSMALLDRIGLRDGHACLDAGCGGGDVTIELARRVAPRGTACGYDIDSTKLQIARDEAARQGIVNVRFELSDIRQAGIRGTFDAVYARFLLTHLRDPAGVVAAFHEILPPESAAFQRYHSLYCSTVTRRGGDPNIGPRLPALLQQCGFGDIDVHVVQPMAIVGDAKLMNALTMESIAAAVLEDGLASQDEIDALVRELYAFAADPHTLAGTPRVVQVVGRRP